MTLGRCMWCNKPAVDAHHLTGRDPNGVQLDPELTAPLCHEDHELAHADLRGAGIDRPDRSGRWSPVAAVERRLRRLGLFFGRLAQHTKTALWPFLAVALVSWADDLAAHLELLDHAFPTWTHLNALELHP